MVKKKCGIVLLKTKNNYFLNERRSFVFTIHKRKFFWNKCPRSQNYVKNSSFVKNYDPLFNFQNNFSYGDFNG